MSSQPSSHSEAGPPCSRVLCRAIPASKSEIRFFYGGRLSQIVQEGAMPRAGDVYLMKRKWVGVYMCAPRKDDDKDFPISPDTFIFAIPSTG